MLTFKTYLIQEARKAEDYIKDRTSKYNKKIELLNDYFFTDQLRSTTSDKFEEFKTLLELDENKFYLFKIKSIYDKLDFSDVKNKKLSDFIDESELYSKSITIFDRPIDGLAYYYAYNYYVLNRIMNELGLNSFLSFNNLYSTNSVFVYLLETEIPVLVEKLEKNSRIDFVLNWMEYIYIMSQPDISDIFNSKVIPKPSISKKLGILYSENLEKEKQSLSWLLKFLKANDTNYIKGLLGNDSFTNYSGINELVSNVRNRLEDSDIYRKIKKELSIDVLPLEECSDTDVILACSKIITNSYDEHNFNLDEAIRGLRFFLNPDIYRPLYKNKEKLNQIKKYKTLDELFDELFVKSSDVKHEDYYYSEDDEESFTWVSEEGSSMHPNFRTQMSNCGTDEVATKILNLCKSFEYAGNEYLYSFITASVLEKNGNKHLLQTHGISNTKPKSRFHGAIVDYILNNIDNISHCTAHKPELNFRKEDVSGKLAEKISNISEVCYKNYKEDGVDEQLEECKKIVEQLNADKSIDARLERIESENPVVKINITIPLPRAMELNEKSNFKFSANNYNFSFDSNTIEYKQYINIADEDFKISSDVLREKLSNFGGVGGVSNFAFRQVIKLLSSSSGVTDFFKSDVLNFLIKKKYYYAYYEQHNYNVRLIPRLNRIDVYHGDFLYSKIDYSIDRFMTSEVIDEVISKYFKNNNEIKDKISLNFSKPISRNETRYELLITDTDMDISPSEYDKKYSIIKDSFSNRFRHDLIDAIERDLEDMEREEEEEEKKRPF